jgi:hypothetical protein
MVLCTPEMVLLTSERVLATPDIVHGAQEMLSSFILAQLGRVRAGEASVQTGLVLVHDACA